MLELKAAILVVLLNQTPSVFDEESKENREIRLEEVASAIAYSSKSVEEASIRLAIGIEESHFAEYVGAGCSQIPEGAPNCDRGKSRSYWQMKPSTCLKGWQFPRGSREALYAFAECSGRVFRGAMRACRGKHPAGPWADGFAGYRTVTECTWAPAARRVRTLQTVWGQLQRELASENDQGSTVWPRAMTWTEFRPERSSWTINSNRRNAVIRITTP
jgi:hypothetical protein